VPQVDAMVDTCGMNHPESSKSFAWGLVAPGRIAQRFAQAVAGLPGTHLHAVHARDAAKAAAFAQQHAGGAPVAQVHTELAAMLADPGIDGIYIATPHSHHGAYTRACLLAGKPVLCEKPLVPTLAAAEALVALAQQRQVFLMEALWSRFLPVWEQVALWLRSGEIGAVRSVQSSFCFKLPFDAQHRAFNPALAGGTLLDIGIYNIALTRFVLECERGVCPEPESVHASGVLAPTGVDQRVGAMFTFPGGVVAQFVCAFDTTSDNGLRIDGELGSISVPRVFWQGTQAVLSRKAMADEICDAPFRINGFEGEIEEAMRCIRAGLPQSPRMPHSETLALVRWMDELRRQVGVVYPAFD
jgi:predicted dehydrogenase